MNSNNESENVNQDILDIIKEILDLPGELKNNEPTIVTNPDEEKNNAFINAFNDLFKKIFKKETPELPLQNELLDKAKDILTLQEPFLQNELLDKIRNILTLPEKEILLTESMFDELKQESQISNELLNKSRNILTFPEKTSESLTESMFEEETKPIIEEEPEKLETIIQTDLLEKIKDILTLPEKTETQLDKSKNILSLPEGPTGEISPVISTEIMGPTGTTMSFTQPLIGKITRPTIEKPIISYMGPTGPFNNVVISTNYSPNNLNLSNEIALNIEKDENNNKYIKMTKL